MACQAVYYRPAREGSVMVRVATLVAAIMATPSTPRELTKKLKFNAAVTNGAVDNTRRQLSHLHNFGLVKIIGKRRSGKRTAYVFAWQTAPFADEDDLLTELDASNKPV